MIVFVIDKDYVWWGHMTCQLKVGRGDMFSQFKTSLGVWTNFRRFFLKEGF